MASRGRPLPFTQRQDIKTMLAQRQPVAMIARVLGLSRNTVRKYRGKV